MNKFLSFVVALSAISAADTALAATLVGSRAAAPTSQSVASKPNAPLQGEITSVDAENHAIVINRQQFTIGAPLLALLDQRPAATGLLDVAALRPGMRVRYRTVPEGRATRVVELWVLRDAAKAQQ